MTASSHSLRDMLGSVFDSIDVNDSYQVVVLFYLAIIPCESCRNELHMDCLFNDVGTPDWCIEAAGVLRLAGWYVPPRVDDTFSVFAVCPKCRSDRDIRSSALPVDTIHGRNGPREDSFSKNT